MGKSSTKFALLSITWLAIFFTGCAIRRQAITPYRLFSEPEDVIHYTVPANCLWAYNIESPISRESIAVMYCMNMKAQ